MRKYPNYKDSEIEYILEIPIQWEIWKLKFLVKEKLKYGANEAAELDDRNLPRYIRITDFDNNGKLREETFKSLPFEIAKDYLLKNGDLLFARSGATVGKTLLFDNYDGIACFAGYLIKASCDAKKLDYKYLDYYTSSSSYQNWKDMVFIQSTIQNIGADKYNLILVPKPPIPEQQAIVRFLDYKTGQIDRFIANRQKQIELLKEQKAGIINKAVTKGINSNAKMKDSGIEWIGEVPEHWEIWKTKFLCKKVSTGNTPSSNELKYYENGTVNWFTPGDFKEEFKMENSQRKVTEIAIEDKECKLFSPNSTYVIGIGATLGKVRMSVAIASSNQQINVLEFNKRVLPEFGFFYFYSIEKTIIANANLSTMGIINQTKMKNLEMPLPRIDEQSAILNYIKNENEAFDTLISKYQKQIDLMKEYRTSLISQAVTGKIDVREWEPKQEAV